MSPSTRSPSDGPALPATRDGEGALERLMEAFLDGDAHAFETLFGRLAPRVARFLRMLCGDPRLAEDLVQITFLKVHRARDTYQRGAPLEPWVFAIARRTFLDHRRKTLRTPERLSGDGTLPEPPPEPAAAPQGFERLSDAQAAQLRARLDKLPAPQREALILLKVEGLSTAEAAAVAGTTPGAIKLRAHRAYESLRHALGMKEKS